MTCSIKLYYYIMYFTIYVETLKTTNNNYELYFVREYTSVKFLKNSSEIHDWIFKSLIGITAVWYRNKLITQSSVGIKTNISVIDSFYLSILECAV